MKKNLKKEIITLKEFSKVDKWDKSFIQLNLDSEIYPNEEFPDRYFLVTKKEINRLIKNTKKRINFYNKNVKPEDNKGYLKYPMGNKII